MLNIEGISPGAFDELFRDITVKIEMYFDGIIALPVTFTTTDYLADCSLLEESAADDLNPLGCVSANEFTFTLNNRSQIFSPQNTTSPYFSKIKTGVQIKAYVQPTHQTEVAWVPMGTFYVSDWNCDLGTIEAHVTCADRLLLIGQMDVPVMQVQTNVNFNVFMERFFDALGLTIGADYRVDATLQQLLKFAWLPSGKVLTFLQTLSQAGLCIIFVDKYNVIQVKGITNIDGAVTEMTNDNQVMSTSIPQSIIRNYSGVDRKSVV